MKKIIALLSALFLGISLAGCTTIDDVAEKPSKTVETKTDEPVVEENSSDDFEFDGSVTYVDDSKEGIVSKIVIYYIGDKVTSQLTTNTLDLTKYAGNEEKVIEEVKKIGESYKDVKGITYSLDIFQTEIVEHISVDFQQLDGDKAKNIPGFVLTGDPKNVSLQKTKELVEQSGYKLQ